METRVVLPVCLALHAAIQLAAGAENLSRATITEVVKDVRLIQSAKAQRPARVDDVVTPAEVLQTGAASRAEMIAPDRTVTRVGANTLFSFEPSKREINLQRGSLLFNSPSGKGGGTIKTAAATASVLGTTLIVTTTKLGGFKVLLLEGLGSVRTPRGETRRLTAGQMTFVLPGEKLGPVYNFQLRDQVFASRLVSGFKQPVPSMPKIVAAVEKQSAQIAKGKYIKTGLLAGDAPDIAYQVDPNAREALLEDEQDVVAEDAVESSSVDLLSLAFATDALIDQPLLETGRVFPPEDLPSARQATGGTFFAARNVQVTSSTVDFSEFAPSGPIQILASEDIRIEASVDLLGLGATPLLIFAGGTITNAPGVFVSVDNPFTQVVAAGSGVDFLAGENPRGMLAGGEPLVFADFSMENSGGDLGLIAPALELDHVRLAAAGNLSITTPGSIKVTGTVGRRPISSNPNLAPGPREGGRGNSFAAGGQVSLNAMEDIQIEATEFTSQQTDLRAGSRVRLRQVRFSDFAAGRAGVRIGADDLIEVANARFQVRDVAMQARTIVLRDVNFAPGSNVTLDSANGRLARFPNSGRPAQANFVNFIEGVRYNGEPAQQFVQPGGPIVIK